MATVEDFYSTLHDLSKLPNSNALENTRRLLKTAQEQMSKPFPHGSSSIEDDNSIRIEWHNDKTSVTMVVFDDHAKSYIHSFGDDRKSGVFNFSAEELADRLDWLQEKEVARGDTTGN